MQCLQSEQDCFLLHLGKFTCVSQCCICLVPDAVARYHQSCFILLSRVGMCNIGLTRLRTRSFFANINIETLNHDICRVCLLNAANYNHWVTQLTHDSLHERFKAFQTFFFRLAIQWRSKISKMVSQRWEWLCNPVHGICPSTIAFKSNILFSFFEDKLLSFFCQKQT